MTSSPLLTIRTLGCRSPSWLLATRMRNAHWRLYLCGVSGAPPAAAPSLFNLPRAVIHTFVCRTAVSFGFREPRYPARSRSSQGNPFLRLVRWRFARDIIHELGHYNAPLLRHRRIGISRRRSDRQRHRRGLSGSDASDDIVSLGPWTLDVLRPLGIKLPLAIKRGYHRHFTRAEMLHWHGRFLISKMAIALPRWNRAFG
jgi:hypothetical protein